MKPPILTDEKLNLLLAPLPPLDGFTPCYAREWKRLFVGEFEVYVGDRIFVVTVVEKLPKSLEEANAFGLSVENVVTKYLGSEGFIDKDKFVYIGLQRFDLINPPEDS